MLVWAAPASASRRCCGAINGLVPHFTGGRWPAGSPSPAATPRTHRPRDLADLVGFVGQDPLAGFVTDTVEDELAYGMESLGLAPDVMRKRVEETLDLLGLADAAQPAAGPRSPAGSSSGSRSARC